MKKIPTIYIRGDDGLVTTEPNPEADWVFAGEGKPTVIKVGVNVCVAVKNGVVEAFWKWREPRKVDELKGAQSFYVLVNRVLSVNKHIVAAFDATDFTRWPTGTWPCEALGPNIQGGVESGVPLLYPFSWQSEYPSGYSWVSSWVGYSIHTALKSFLLYYRPDIEGIVWHHPDGRYAKLKRKDFGLPWPPARHEK